MPESDQTETSFLRRAAAESGIAPDDLERACMEFLHSGSEKGFQSLRFVLDFIMDARQERWSDFNPTVLREAQAETLKLVNRAAKEIGEVTEANPVIEEWARKYTVGHAWRTATDVDIATEVLGQIAAAGETEPRILDVGAAPYLFTTVMKRKGFLIDGIDIDPARQKNFVAKEGLNILSHDLESADKGRRFAGKYDVITFNKIFEHLRINPLEVLRKLHSWLKPEGYLILSTPNCQSLEGFRYYLNRGAICGRGAVPFNEYSKLERLGHMGHVREYTANEVLDTIGRLGFRARNLIYRFHPGLMAKNEIGTARTRWGTDFVILAKKRVTCRSKAFVSRTR